MAWKKSLEKLMCAESYTKVPFSVLSFSHCFLFVMLLTGLDLRKVHKKILRLEWHGLRGNSANLFLREDKPRDSERIQNCSGSLRWRGPHKNAWRQMSAQVHLCMSSEPTRREINKIGPLWSAKLSQHKNRYIRSKTVTHTEDCGRTKMNSVNSRSTLTHDWWS